MPTPTNSIPLRTFAIWIAKASTCRVLFPTIGLYIMWRDDIDPELSAAICRAYNTWLADYCDYDRKRLYGVMLIPLQDPGARRRRAEICARKTRPGRHFLAAE